MILANQYLSQYWDLKGPQLFNQYLNRNIFMIFWEKWIVRKKGIKHVKYTLISDVVFKIKKFTVQLANENFLIVFE